MEKNYRNENPDENIGHNAKTELKYFIDDP